MAVWQGDRWHGTESNQLSFCLLISVLVSSFSHYRGRIKVFNTSLNMLLWSLGNYEKSILYKLLICQDVRRCCRNSQLKNTKIDHFCPYVWWSGICSCWKGRSCISEPIQRRAAGGRPEVSARLHLHSLFLLFAGSWSIKSDCSRLNKVKKIIIKKSASMLLKVLPKEWTEIHQLLLALSNKGVLLYAAPYSPGRE